MSTEQNKAVVRRFIEDVLYNQNVAIADELMAPDYVNHSVPGGREGIKQFFTMMRSAFPDFKYGGNIEHLIAEGDYVVVRSTYHYTNDGKEATGSDLSEYRLVNGKIVEDWPPSGNADLLKQIGVTLPSE
jgi:predicted SnoaL-like aldol condensation-catalyzing enzyme